MRLKLTIAYNGAPYKGWACQPKMATIQETIESNICELTKQPVKIYGSGRTDTGVHAHGQVAHFDVPGGISIPCEKWAPALNTKLPHSIRILKSEQVADDFHARFSATSKSYIYTVDTSAVLHPHQFERAWHLPRKLNLELLEECLNLYTGEHDFRHFSALRGNETAESSFVRHITEAVLTPTTTGFQLNFSANGFLYKMVRILTGVAIHVAQNQVPIDQFKKMLSIPEGNYNVAKFCAPGSGLSLRKVLY